MPNLILLVGPQGSGKSTRARYYVSEGYSYINQDLQGKQGHYRLFNEAIAANRDIIVDRINHTRGARSRYLDIAKASGYSTRIIVLHENYETCLARCNARQDHPTIKDELTAIKALNMFFSKYEKPEETEADLIDFRWPEGDKQPAIICDLDSTLCNIEHRLHHVQNGKKDWKSFFEGIPRDSLNQWCYELVRRFSGNYKIIFCSGRSDDYRKVTNEWLSKHKLNYLFYDLYMRNRHDHRNDTIVKQNILDFELKTRYNILMAIDDRPSVCRMWRANDILCLQVQDKEF